MLGRGPHIGKDERVAEGNTKGNNDPNYPYQIESNAATGARKEYIHRENRAIERILEQAI
jgi:hypothetical protein